MDENVKYICTNKVSTD